MPRGPKGEKRPADVIGAAIMVASDRPRGSQVLVREQRPHFTGKAADVRF
jgi:hypothetical protein